MTLLVIEMTVPVILSHLGVVLDGWSDVSLKGHNVAIVSKL
jgi:hypothetical protein